MEDIENINVDAEIYLNEYTKNFIENQTVLISIAIIYGLNAIARAINPDQAETSMQLLERVWGQFHINKD